LTVSRVAQGFSWNLTYLIWGLDLNAEEAKVAVEAVVEANKERKRLVDTLKGNDCVASETKKVFREGHESKLIKLGVALIAFPEPTPVSEIVGAGCVAAGAVQKGIRNRAAFADDIGKEFKKAFKELSLAKDKIRI
jgi:hypothetical protein